MKEFKINEHGVCINPDTEKIYNDQHFRAIIKTAQNEGRWAWGCEFQIHGTGLGCWGHSGLPGFSKYRREFYPSQEEARAAAIRYAIAAFSRSSERSPVAPVIQALNKALTPQLSLF